MEELFRLFQRFDKIKTGEAQPLSNEEQKTLLNRQRGTGRYYGTYDGSVPNFDGGKTSSNKLINNYVSNYKQQQRVQEQIQQANIGLESRTGDSLIAQKEYIKTLEQK